MGTLAGTLTLPAVGTKAAVRTRVDYQNTQEGALVRRAQSGDETAFQELVEKYQSKVFSIIHGIVRHRNDVGLPFHTRRRVADLGRTVVIYRKTANNRVDLVPIAYRIVKALQQHHADTAAENGSLGVGVECAAVTVR